MKKSTIVRRAMFRNVLSVLNQHQGQLQQVPGFSDARLALETKIQTLETALHHQHLAMKDASLEKSLFFAELTSLVIKMKGALYLHGQLTGNLILMNRHKESRAMIERANKAKLHLLCDMLAQDLNSLENELLSFGVSAEELLLFHSLHELFEDKNNQVRIAVINRSLATKQIDDIEKEITNLIASKVDRILFYATQKKGDLFKRYQSARRIMDPRGKKIDRDDGLSIS